MAIPMLKPTPDSSLAVLPPGREGKPIAVYGAGTGLGVSHLVHVDKRWVSLPMKVATWTLHRTAKKGHYSGRATR